MNDVDGTVGRATGVARLSGERIRAARLAAGLSREAVALAVRRTAGSVYLWETDRITPPTPIVERLAAVLGCEPGDLFAARER